MLTRANGNNVHILGALERGNLAERDVVIGRELRRVHERSRPVTSGHQETLERAERQDLRTGTGEVTLVDDLEVSRLPVKQATNKATQYFGEPHEGAHGIRDLTGRDVDRERYEVTRQRQLDLLRNSNTGLVLRLHRRGTEVRHHHDGGQREQR